MVHTLKFHTQHSSKQHNTRWPKPTKLSLIESKSTYINLVNAGDIKSTKQGKHWKILQNPQQLQYSTHHQDIRKISTHIHNQRTT
jgi:hypothetical protein